MRSLITLLVTASLAAGCASRSGPAQARPGPNSPAAGRTISEASVRAHMEFLASDAMNGRGSGTRDEWIAATYIASHLRRWGLDPIDGSGYLQEIRIERSEIAGPPVLTFGGQKAVHGKDMTVTSIAGAALAGPLKKWQPGMAVTRGAILLLPEQDPPGAAETSRAAIVLSLESEQVRTRRQSGARPGRPLSMQWLAGTPKVAAVALGRETYDAVAAMADGAVLTLDAEARPAQTSRTWNVVGRISGSAPGPSVDAIVLSAHLDHIGSRAAPNAAAGADTINNGADDDASGTIAVLELAQAMSAGKRPERTVIFAWFGSEEGGGFG